MAAFTAVEKKLNDTGSTVKSSRYVTVGTTWFSGTFTKVVKAGQVTGSKTREKFQLAVSNLTTTNSQISVRFGLCLNYLW
ncbi:hypothetical protein GIB67_009493 [Kingdonia uniflora]|uniref:Uncharacterized protein n=1 Tax=Kingdonia uniflora TaxID=39325 RepID=A0A7J7N3G8_9MAGN|nr:hypothetical protein GIB67_009493 [Kingdonia uniflora]